MDKIEQLRLEVRADFAIMHALYGDLASLVGSQNQQLGKQQEQLAAQQQISREMARVVARVQGQSRLQSERFDTILAVISGEIGNGARVDALEDRVEAIERKLAS
jgi:hypothetical protein